MRWPWQRTPEKRQSTQPFTDAIQAAIAAQAGGNLTGNPLALGALEMASGAYGRAFAAATLTPPVPSLTPAIRASIARSLVRRGESVFLIQVKGGAVRLIPCGSWDVRGGWERESWFYRLDTFGPSGNTTHFVPGSAVLHPMYSYDAARPWLGLSPLQWASLTGTLAANLESKLGEEAGGSVGHLLPVPQDPANGDSDGDGEDDEADEKPLDALRSDLANLHGRTALVESVAGGWGEGKSAAPMFDWKPQRFGASPPQTLAVLRSDAGQAVLGACGVPVSLFTDADGTAARESWRRFVMGSVEPVAALVAAELSSKLEIPGLRFGFESLWAHDLAGRAQSFKAFVAGGMDVERAAALSGLTAIDE